MYYPKDFILTPKGLGFAVVASGLEEGRVLCFLRYHQTPTGWQKLGTTEANALLATQFPQYLYYSKQRDTACHAVPLEMIQQHFQPQQRLQQLLVDCPNDPVLETCVALARLLQAHGINGEMVGITGSLLIGAQHPASDLDLVFYDRTVFHQCRQLLPDLTAEHLLQPLTEPDWLQAYHRRDCELTYADYVWHEQRKANKAMFQGRKVDLSFVSHEQPTSESTHYQKQGAVTRTLQVLDDRWSFDYPAVFIVNADDVEQVVCYTATYSGQAIAGEWITVAGQLEIAANGHARIVVGASREAKDEYIKVVRTHDD